MEDDMASKNKHLSLKHISVLSFSALTVAFGALGGSGCNAGEEIIPVATGGSAGSGMVTTSAGMMSSTAGSTPMTTAGSGGSVASTAGSGGMPATAGSGGVPATAGSGGVPATAGSGGSGGATVNLAEVVMGWNGW